METRKTTLLLFLILTSGLYLLGQKTGVKDVKEFSLSITTYNHAQRIFDGVMTYKITDNILTIRQSIGLSGKDTLLFSKTIDDKSVGLIKNISLENLKDFYFNRCIMATSGNEYFVFKTDDTITQKISLHHYYEPQIERLFEQINKHIPDNLKHDYLTKDTQQDCEP